MFSFKIFGVQDLTVAQDRLKGIKGGLKKAPRAAIKGSTTTYMSLLQNEIPISDRDREHARDLVTFGGIEMTEDGAEAKLVGPDYLQYVIKGSDEVTIDAVSGQAMHFEWMGDEWFLSSVTRPARDANDFLRRAWNKARDGVKKQMKELGLRVARVEPIEE